MNKHNIRKLCLLALTSFLLTGSCTACFAGSIPFADNGTLKMLYDNRMYPQAVEYDGNIYIVWRGEKGFPYIITYHLKNRKFSQPYMLLTNRENQVNARKYKRDHHYAPVIWCDPKGHLHVLFGCHNSTGIHLISKKSGQITQWKEGSPVADILSYPKVHQIYDRKTLIYFRHQGHLGSWQYRVSSDFGKTWVSPANPVVDLNREPQDGVMADHAGSYNTTRVSKDGRTLHVAFIWKVENPVMNSRYRRILDDHTQRYNLYYLKVDLPSGKAFNTQGTQIAMPINKSTADRQCLVWDTNERVAAVGPSIYLDQNDQPYFLLPVSEVTPYRCRFYFVKRQNDQWIKTPITRTAHPFNASHLDRTDDGLFRAYLITGGGENSSEVGMDNYGWGDRVELWISDHNGSNWKLRKDLTPVQGHKYQNIKTVWPGMGGLTRNIFLFYSWQDSHDNGIAYLWDDKIYTFTSKVYTGRSQ